MLSTETVVARRGLLHRPADVIFDADVLGRDVVFATRDRHSTLGNMSFAEKRDRLTPKAAPSVTARG